MNVCPDYDLQPDRISPVLKQGVERSTCSVPTLTQKDYSPMKVESNRDSEIFQPLHPEGNESKCDWGGWNSNIPHSTHASPQDSNTAAPLSIFRLHPYPSCRDPLSGDCDRRKGQEHTRVWTPGRGAAGRAPPAESASANERLRSRDDECGEAAGPMRLQARPRGGDGRRGRGRWRHNYINRSFSPWNARDAPASPTQLLLDAGGGPQAIFSISSRCSLQARGGC